MSRRRLGFESLERRGMLAGLAGALPQLDGAPEWTDMGEHPDVAHDDAHAAIVRGPETGFAPVSVEGPPVFVSDHVPYDWGDYDFARNVRNWYKSFIESNPGWLSEHDLGESDPQVETTSRNLPWMTFGSSSLAEAFDAWFERYFPNGGDYAAFLDEHPTWIEEHGEDGRVPSVAADSWYVPWMSFGDSAEARAFDAWFELTYPDFNEFESALKEDPSLYVRDPFMVEACIAVGSRSLPWLQFGGPSFSRAFDAWVEQAHPEYAARMKERFGGGDSPLSPAGESPVWGMISIPAPPPQWTEAPPLVLTPEMEAEPEMEAGPGLDAEPETVAEPEVDAGLGLDAEDGDAAVQRNLFGLEQPVNNTAVVASWLTVSGIEADGTKLPGGKKRLR